MPNDISYDDIINKDILELMGAKNLPEEKKKELYTKILETIQNRTIAKIAQMLSDDDLENWRKIADTKDKTRMNEFLNSKSIDLTKMMTEEAIIYKLELYEISKPIRKAAGITQKKEE